MFCHSLFEAISFSQLQHLEYDDPWTMCTVLAPQQHNQISTTVCLEILLPKSLTKMFSKWQMCGFQRRSTCLSVSDVLLTSAQFIAIKKKEYIYIHLLWILNSRQAVSLHQQSPQLCFFCIVLSVLLLISPFILITHGQSQKKKKKKSFCNILYWKNIYTEVINFLLKTVAKITAHLGLGLFYCSFDEVNKT